MSVKVCSPLFSPPSSPKLGLKNNNKKRPFSATALLRTTAAETKYSVAENMIGTASAAGGISAVSRVVETNNSNNQLTAQQR